MYGVGRMAVASNDGDKGLGPGTDFTFGDMAYVGSIGWMVWVVVGVCVFLPVTTVLHNTMWPYTKCMHLLVFACDCCCKNV